MSLVAIETVAVRVACARQALKLRDAALSVVASSQLLQVLADYLVEALAESLRPLSGALDGLLVHGKSNIHEHSIRAHIYCVNHPNPVYPTAALCASRALMIASANSEVPAVPPTLSLRPWKRKALRLDRPHRWRCGSSRRRRPRRDGAA